MFFSFTSTIFYCKKSYSSPEHVLEIATAGKESIFTHSFANRNVIITCSLVNKIIHKNFDFFR